ncbi:MAG TPA: DUF1440 domain-containing protein [Pyrinomonadaceae bacterium]|nr:DUF1440 domain-containing protein [Pyrinomonadaceae bacterium]
MNGKEEANIWKGFAAGLVGGLFAGWTMNQFQKTWTKLAKGFEKSHGAQSMQPSDDSSSTANNGQHDDATVEVAEIISENVFGRELKESEKENAGALVHYGFSAAAGGFYGAVAEFAPAISTKAGLPFGVVFWAIADEITVPLLGLSKGPTEIPISTHAYALSAHLVYGLTAEFTRRGLRKLL